MIPLLADITSSAGAMIDAGTVGTIIGGAVATALGIKLKRRSDEVTKVKQEAKNEAERCKMELVNKPLVTRRADDYATKDELRKLEADLKEVIKDIRDNATLNTNNLHQRLNGITQKLNNVDGKMDVVLNFVKQIQ